MKKRIYGLETEYGFTGKSVISKLPEWLCNGARLYADGDHPEYATPECASVRDLVKHDKAGELLVQKAFEGKLYKNNVAAAISGAGLSSFGCHENYLTAARPLIELVPSLIPFLVTRQLFTGAGGGLAHGKYLISPRAMHINKEFSAITTANERGIVCLRDEPHADQLKYKRLHLITADANMSEVSTYMKMGTTSIVLDLIEEGRLPLISLSRPVDTLKALSWNTSGGWMVKTGDGKAMRATDVQRIYLDTAIRFASPDQTTFDVLGRWAKYLDALDRDPQELAGAVEWVMKREVLEAFAAEEQIPVGHQRVKNLELQMTDIDRKESRYYFLEKKGLVERIVTDEEILEATMEPPRDTRAFCRANMIYSKSCRPISIDWEKVMMEGGATFSLKDPLDSYNRYLDELGIKVQPRRKDFWDYFMELLFGKE